MFARRSPATAALLAASLAAATLLAGCRSKEDRALDQAKSQAAATNTAQQIQYIDRNGDTVITTVQPPAAGQPQSITTITSPPAPGPVPHHTDPVITPIGANGLPAPTGAAPSQQTVTTAAPGQSPMVPATDAQPAPAAVAPVHLIVPAGTSLAIRIDRHISVKTSHAGDHFSGEVVEPVLVDGNTVIPRNTRVGGRVDASHRRGHFKGSSLLELRLTSIALNGNQYELDTHDAVRTKKGKGKRTAGFLGGMTGAGMLIGGIATGGVGLAIGAAAGAGGGTLLAGATGNRDIDIPAESVIRFRLSDPLVVQNP